MEGSDKTKPSARASSADKRDHIPVLLNEFVQAVQIQPGEKWVDGTFGRGGHTRAILEQGALVLALDQDPEVAGAAEEIRGKSPDNFRWIQENFRNLKTCCKQAGWGAVQGILLDLGVSSPQLDNPARGFSFQNDGPLDMRMNLHQPTTAADLVNTCPETELAAIFYEHGNEKASRQIARAIIKRRQTKRFLNTLDLAGVVAETIPYRRSTGLHPATKVFQALRIAVNQESAALEEVLPQAVEMLATGGTLAVISFHSGEDKVVKDFLRNHSQEWLDTPDYPNSLPNPLRQLQSPKRILPSENEMIANPRSRSARLRIAKKL